MRMSAASRKLSLRMQALKKKRREKYILYIKKKDLPGFSVSTVRADYPKGCHLLMVLTASRPQGSAIL